MGIQQEECCIWGTKLFWISSSQKISLTAGKDISMMDEKEHHETIHEYHSHVSGLLSSKTKDLYEAGKTDTVRGSLISGNETHMESGRDMTITGSAVVSSKDTTLLAGRNFKADSAEERSGSTYRESVKKRGLLSGGGLGFTLGSEKRKDRYDSEAVEQVGSTIGSVEGSVRIGAGKDADIEASHVSAGKDLAISGKNVTITSKDNVYTNKEEHEYKRSGLSVSLGGSLVNTVNSVVSPLTRAGKVKDRRLSALYGLEAGKNLKGAVSGYMDNVKTIDAMKADMSRIDTLREAVKTDGIAAPMTESNLENIRDAEGKIMDKAKADNKARRSMSLDVSFGTAQSHSLSEERTIQTEGSTLHAKDTLTVKSGEDMTVKGSQMSAEEVYLKAGKDIRILSAENSSTTREKENSSSASLGGSIGSSGLTGIRASYGSGREAGMGEEISHTESTIKADHTLSLESGRDTDLKGSRIEGEQVQADVGGSLSMESEQDRKTYRESGKNTGISLGYDIPSGKVSGFASTGKSHTDSHYESVINQAGIYAGDKGFDIIVRDNTHLKGAVIDSKGSADKNTLRTGTLSWEDVENKADYKAGGMGISYAPKDSTTPLNARGLTPQMSPTVKDKADSNTKAAIAKGTIIITDKKNQGQDISTLNRDTENSLNKLKEIFDKSKVEEKQELLGMMEKYGNQAIHAYAESRGWKDGSAEKVLLHGAFGALMGDMGTGEPLAGALSGSIHEYVMGYLNRMKSPEWVRTHPDAVEWLSAGLGAVIGKVSDASISGMAGVSLDAAKWNEYQNIRELRDKIERLKTSGALNRLSDNEYVVLYAEHNGTTVGVAVDKEGNATDVNLIEGPKQRNFQLNEGSSLGSAGDEIQIYTVQDPVEYFHKSRNERRLSNEVSTYEIGQYDGNIYRPGFYKEDVDKLMNNPLWKKADMLLKISGPTIGEYVPNNLGADFNRGYGYFSRVRTLYTSDDKGEAAAGLLGAYGAGKGATYVLDNAGIFAGKPGVIRLMGKGGIIFVVSYIGGAIIKGIYDNWENQKENAPKEAKYIYLRSQSHTWEDNN